MRRWFLLLMIALLPLRGWVGEAMAGEMLAQHIGGAAMAEAAPGHAPHSAPRAAHDCMDAHAAGHGHGFAQGLPAPSHDEPAAQAQPQAASAPDAAHGDCPTCAACQVCSSVALGIEAPALLAHGPAQARPASPEFHFASAEPARDARPPIS